MFVAMNQADYGSEWGGFEAVIRIYEPKLQSWTQRNGFLNMELVRTSMNACRRLHGI